MTCLYTPLIYYLTTYEYIKAMITIVSKAIVRVLSFAEATVRGCASPLLKEGLAIDVVLPHGCSLPGKECSLQ